jgi:hypothetical protein
MLLGTEPGINDADLAARAAAVREQLGASFTTLVERPFVVTGDETAAEVQRRSRSTVRWASDLLRKDYFARDPDKVFTIYLFKDALSYETNALRLFGDKPTSPYGYCSSRHRALVMNIATGGGTLVHEMVHAFMHSNVPDCPDWINEGLASLYEQCAERDGHIIGLVNWRLPVIQQAITAGTAPSWTQLTGLPDGEFYHGNGGANYAAARYTMLWLQENNLLTRFWKGWLANRAEDANGLKAMKTLFPDEELATVEQRWRNWVKDLKRR